MQNAAQAFACFRLVVDWRLDPEKFPKRLDLEVSEKVLCRLQEISLRTGLSVAEIASALVAQGAELSFRADQDPLESK